MDADWTLSVSQLNEYVRRLLAGDPMLRSLRDKMTACSDETQSVDIMRDFFIELRTAFEGSGGEWGTEPQMAT